MRVIVFDDVFDGHVTSPGLFELFNFAFRRRHRVIVQRGPLFKRWWGSLPDDAREKYDDALHASVEAESREPSEHEFRVGTGAGCVSVDDTIERLGRPFLLFLENERSDRAFLESVALTSHRDRLRWMHRQGWIAFRSHGGISTIKKLLTQELEEFPEDTWRMFAIFDSDAPAPGKPSGEAQGVAQACTERRVPHRMLGRRSIENYLTRPALERWANGQSNPDALRGRIEALYGESFNQRPERRYHFLMKTGFQRMSPLDPIYDGVPENIKRSLREGFGTHACDAFTPDLVQEVDLRDESAWDELSEMIEAMIRSMR